MEEPVEDILAGERLARIWSLACRLLTNVLDLEDVDAVSAAMVEAILVAVEVERELFAAASVLIVQNGGVVIAPSPRMDALVVGNLGGEVTDAAE